MFTHRSILSEGLVIFSVLMVGAMQRVRADSLDTSQTAVAPVVHDLTDTQIRNEIRATIVEDQTLPYCAHIVRVHAENGKFILNGIVHTQEQKQTIEDKAEDIAGDDNVINNILVKGS